MVINSFKYLEIMRKYFVFLIVSAMALLTSCGSTKGVGNKTQQPTNSTPKTNTIKISTAKNALLKSTDTKGVVSYTLFDVDSKTLTREETKQLDALVKEIKTMGKCQVSVIGHTDNIGTSDVNEGVSMKRARLVSDYLKNKGITNITTTGESYDHPIAGNDTAAGRAKNRRVEIFVSTVGKYNPYKK